MTTGTTQIAGMVVNCKLVNIVREVYKDRVLVSGLYRVSVADHYFTVDNFTPDDSDTRCKNSIPVPHYQDVQEESA